MPSVPLPLSAPKAAATAARGGGGTKKVATTRRASLGSIAVPRSNNAHVVPLGLAGATGAANPANSGAAYERKKQRAKDSRVKLNDSIERLSVAIGLAGSQSKQRAAQLSSSLRPNPDSKIAVYRPTTLRAIEDCARETENAKKWDRPSFVGTAATLVQGLNAQCEALMREMVEWKNEAIEQRKRCHEMEKAGTGIKENAVASCKCGFTVKKDDSPAMLGSVAPDEMSSKSAPLLPLPAGEITMGKKVVKIDEGKVSGLWYSPENRGEPEAAEGKNSNNSLRQQYDVTSTIVQASPKRRRVSCNEASKEPSVGDFANEPLKQTNGEISGGNQPKPISVKRRKNEETPKASQKPGTSSYGPILRFVSSYLDPKSIKSCACVAKLWSTNDDNADNVFRPSDADNVFLSDDVWLDLCVLRFGMTNVRQWQQEGHDDDDNEDENEGVPLMAMFDLYHRMDHANVKPPCLREGNVLLGHARIGRSVSAWCSIVERSNGETARCVRRVRDDASRGYVSLPLIELRILIQNIGSSDMPVKVKDEGVTVDASTRRRDETMHEVTSDERFDRIAMTTNGTVLHRSSSSLASSAGEQNEMCCLNLFQSAVVVSYVHARGCATSFKFRRRANFVKILVVVDGTTVPLVIPFSRSSGMDRGTNS